MPEAKDQGIFPTFFLSGFECSTFLWGENRIRRDLAQETDHYARADEDYRILAQHGFGVAREGIPWPMVDRGNGYDFSIIQPFLDAQRKNKVVPIWDLCHYGYPDRLDPLSDEFPEAFAAYCAAAAQHVSGEYEGPCFFTPINEMTFFAFMAGEWGWSAPFLKGKENRYRLRYALARASIQGVKAIRKILPESRMVHVDPLILVVPPKDRPDLADEAWHETYNDTFFCWDVLAGRIHPELGGSKEILDIVGVNNYSFGQMEYRENGPHDALDPDDSRIKPLGELLKIVWDRYRRPMIIAETSGMNEGRPSWLKDVMEESLTVVREGMELHGICLFPGVDMPNWHTGRWLHNGFCDIVGPTKARVVYEPYAEELRRWQKLLNRVEVLDEDPLSDPVDLADVRRGAEIFKTQSDANWN
ncbi:b-glycosidase [bacterium]|nr:MAG: b-glycosidase [bacterium]